MLLPMVEVGLVEPWLRAWMMTFGDEETALGLILLPRVTALCESG